MGLFEVTYEGDTDSMYLYLTAERKDGQAARQVVVENGPAGSEVVLDFSDSGTLLGIEILGASRCVTQELMRVATNK
jgi:uncharacterized protein YuzE